MSYEIGKVYTFKVKKRFTSQTEIIDEATKVTTYLHNTERLNLPKGLEVKCRVTFMSGARPVVELVDLDVFKFDAGLTLTKLTNLLKENDYEWDTAKFAELILAEDSEESFESRCYDWLDEVRKSFDLKIIYDDCSDILELSNFLDLCGPAQRVYYQERLTVLIEIIGNYIEAARKIEDNTTGEFIQNIFRKLSISGFVYHPDKNFSILASIFLLKPEMMGECIGELLEIIRKRDITTWKQEPFNTALTRLLEMYLRVSLYTIDREKEPKKTEKIKNCINALAIQLSLAGSDESAVIDPRIATARLCTVSTYVNPQSSIKLLDNAFEYLFSDDIHQLNFASIDIERIPYILANHDAADSIDTTNVFIHGNARLEISKNGISLGAADSETRDNPVFPSKFKLWQNLQVYLESRLAAPLPATSSSKNLKPYEDAWAAIESDLFRPRRIHQAETVTRQHRTGESVQIRIVRQDLRDQQKFHCEIVDEIGGEGYIYVKPDIVPYTVYSTQLTAFLGKKFNADIIGRDTDGQFHFSMSADVKGAVAQEFQPGDEIVCWLGYAPSRVNRLAPAVSKDGASVTLQVPKPLMAANLTQGTIVRARVLRSTPAEDSSHLFAEVLEIAPDEDVNVSEAFDTLLNAVGFEDDFEFIGSQAARQQETQDEDDDNLEKELDEDFIRQIIFCIDRMAMIDPDYIKSYNYLWFCDLMSRMIGLHNLSNYYKGRKGIISMLHYFAKNNVLDEEELSRFELDNSDLLSNNSPLRERFLQLQAVSFINKPDRYADLTEMADKYPTLRPLARLIIAYNIVQEAGMAQNAADIHNKIKNLLNLKGFDSNLKYYGQEGPEVEFKTSIVTPAGERHPNHERQMNEILSVINSFLNTSGGTLYVGVNDTGMGTGVEADLASPLFNHDRDRYIRAIIDAVAIRWGNLVSTFISAHFDAENPRKDVLIVNVKPYPKGVRMPDGRFLVRVDSTKRGLSEDEFRQYLKQHRPAGDDANAPEETPFEPQEAIETAEPSAAFPTVGATSSATVATSRIRKNVKESWEDNYVEPVAFLKIMDNNRFVKIDEFDYDYDPMLTLTVLHDELDGYLVLGYDNGHVARVRVDEIMQYDSTQRHRFDGANLVFASIAHDDDLVLTIMAENKNNGKTVMRADRVASFEEGNLQCSGSPVCNESLIGNIIAYDVIPASMADDFGGIVGLDSTKCGHTANNKTRRMIEKLNEMGITEITL